MAEVSWCREITEGGGGVGLGERARDWGGNVKKCRGATASPSCKSAGDESRALTVPIPALSAIEAAGGCFMLLTFLRGTAVSKL